MPLAWVHACVPLPRRPIEGPTQDRRLVQGASQVVTPPEDDSALWCEETRVGSPASVALACVGTTEAWDGPPRAPVVMSRLLDRYVIRVVAGAEAADRVRPAHRGRQRRRSRRGSGEYAFFGRDRSRRRRGAHGPRAHRRRLRHRGEAARRTTRRHARSRKRPRRAPRSTKRNAPRSAPASGTTPGNAGPSPSRWSRAMKPEPGRRMPPRRLNRLAVVVVAVLGAAACSRTTSTSARSDTAPAAPAIRATPRVAQAASAGSATPEPPRPFGRRTRRPRRLPGRSRDCRKARRAGPGGAHLAAARRPGDRSTRSMAASRCACPPVSSSRTTPRTAASSSSARSARPRWAPTAASARSRCTCSASRDRSTGSSPTRARARRSSHFSRTTRSPITPRRASCRTSTITWAPATRSVRPRGRQAGLRLRHGRRGLQHRRRARRSRAARVAPGPRRVELVDHDRPARMPSSAWSSAPSSRASCSTTMPFTEPASAPRDRHGELGEEGTKARHPAIGRLAGVGVGGLALSSFAFALG